MSSAQSENDPSLYLFLQRKPAGKPTDTFTIEAVISWEGTNPVTKELTAVGNWACVVGDVSTMERYLDDQVTADHHTESLLSGCDFVQHCSHDEEWGGSNRSLDDLRAVIVAAEDEDLSRGKPKFAVPEEWSEESRFIVSVDGNMLAICVVGLPSTEDPFACIEIEWSSSNVDSAAKLKPQLKGALNVVGRDRLKVMEDILKPLSEMLCACLDDKVGAYTRPTWHRVCETKYAAKEGKIISCLSLSRTRQQRGAKE